MGHDFLILIIKFEYRIYDIAIPNLILTLIYSAKYHEENYAKVSEHGGTPKSGVVKDLSYLVTNSAEQTSKYTKAQDQGSKIITEEEFLVMINE